MISLRDNVLSSISSSPQCSLSGTLRSMRYVSMVAMAALLLAGCTSGNGSGTVTVACETTFWNGTVGACLPAGWAILSTDDMRTLGVAEETVAAFQASEPKGGQFDTVTVTAEPLVREMTTPEYSKANIQAVGVLPEYALIDTTTVYVDGNETAIHSFKARPSPDSPIRRYYQLSAASNRIGYTFTAAYPLTIHENQEAEVLAILKSATFRTAVSASEASE